MQVLWARHSWHLKVLGGLAILGFLHLLGHGRISCCGTRVPVAALTSTRAGSVESCMPSLVTRYSQNQTSAIRPQCVAFCTLPKRVCVERLKSCLQPCSWPACFVQPPVISQLTRCQTYRSSSSGHVASCLVPVAIQ